MPSRRGPTQLEFSWTPTIQDGSDSGLIRGQQVRKEAQIGSKSDDPSDLQIAIGPAIQPMTDAAGAGIRCDLACTKCGHGVVHRRVTERTLNTHRVQRSGRVEEARQTDLDRHFHRLFRLPHSSCGDFAKGQK